MLGVKTISYDGVAAATEDAVADAVLEFTMVVARYGLYERVTVPVLVAGRTERLTLVLGPTIHLSLLTDSSGVIAADIEGAAEAVEEIRRRTEAITAPLESVAEGASALLDEQS